MPLLNPCKQHTHNPQPTPGEFLATALFCAGVIRFVMIEPPMKGEDLLRIIRASTHPGLDRETFDGIVEYLDRQGYIHRDPVDGTLYPY